MTKNSLSKPAQFSFAADLFMLQAILWSEENVGEAPWPLEYIFPNACFDQIIDPLLDNPEQVGLELFIGVKIIPLSSGVKVVFPNEDEQDKMHTFFTMVNQKRKLAQGYDHNFPPMPDIYQGGSKPDVHAIKRYMAFIVDAFNGDSDVVTIPIGPRGEEITFNCN